MAKETFRFYHQTLAMSFETPKEEGNEELKSDFIMEGDIDWLTNGLIQLMGRHPKLAVVITQAAYNYILENGKPEKPIKRWN